MGDNLGHCAYSAGDDDRIFYLSNDHGSRWKYKTEALASGWARELHLNIINLRQSSEWVIFLRKTSEQRLKDQELVMGRPLLLEVRKEKS